LAPGRYVGLTVASVRGGDYSVAYAYSPADARLSTITSPAGSFAYSYFPNSNLISSVTSAASKVTREYEPDRNLLSKLQTETGANVLIAAYKYTHDDLGRRITVAQTGQLYAPYTPDGQPMQTAYGYNNRNELITAQTTVGGALLAGRNFGYDFDPIGNRTTEIIEGENHGYTANELNQYTQRYTPWWLPVSGIAPAGSQVTIGGVNGNEPPDNWLNNYYYKKEQKKPDNPGNTGQLQPVPITVTTNSSSRTETRNPLARPTLEKFLYDLDGNLTQDSLWTYTYDGENRLSTMTSRMPDATNNYTHVRFTYDYMGRRVRKNVYLDAGATTLKTSTIFLYQGWALLAEYSAASPSSSALTLVRRYTWGPDLSGTLGGAGDIGGLLAIEDLRTGWQGIFHPSFDGNGNLMALHEASTGNMVAAYEYDPFGNPVRTSGVYAKENPIRFSGKYYDTETQLSYFGYRYYSASLGRFINRDLLEERGAWNLYSGLNQRAADPYAGASGVEGTSWQTKWQQAQDRLLSNTSLPHTTQSITFDGKRNSGLPGASEDNQKTYSANATGHYPQGGAPDMGPKPPSMTVGDPALGNADTNLYIFTGNNPVNNYDALGLSLWSSVKEFFGGVSLGVGEVFDPSGSVTRNVNNTLNASETQLSSPATAGRIAGNALATVFGGVEMDVGGGMMAVGGAAMGIGTVGGIATSETGVGALAGAGIDLGGAVVAAGGLVVAGHGVLTTVRGGTALLTNIQSAVSSSSATAGGNTPNSASVKWTSYGGRHVAPKNTPWAKVVEGTKSGNAKYKPGTNIEALERRVWAEGTPATNGKPWKVMEMPEEIGASGGKSSRWMRVEMSGNTIHGHPITEVEFNKLTRIQN